MQKHKESYMFAGKPRDMSHRPWPESPEPVAVSSVRGCRARADGAGRSAVAVPAANRRCPAVAGFLR